MFLTCGLFFVGHSEISGLRQQSHEHPNIEGKNGTPYERMNSNVIAQKNILCHVHNFILITEQ